MLNQWHINMVLAIYLLMNRGIKMFDGIEYNVFGNFATYDTGAQCVQVCFEDSFMPECNGVCFVDSEKYRIY